METQVDLSRLTDGPSICIQVYISPFVDETEWCLVVIVNCDSSVLLFGIALIARLFAIST
jgi:hypothetical protein